MSVQLKLQQALALHQRGELLPAQSLYEQILGEQPLHFDALHLLGVIASQTRNPRTALEMFDRALDIDSGNAVAHFNRGTALQDLKQWRGAVESYDRAIVLAPKFAEAYSNRAVVQTELKQFEAALASCNLAIAVKGDFAAAYFNRGNVYAALRQWEPALGSYDQAIALRANYPEALCNRGNALRELGRLAAALASYDRAIALRGDYAEAFCNRGNVLRELKQWEAALQSYDRAIALDPNSAEVCNNRATVLSRLDRLEAALASCDRAIQIAPTVAEFYSNRAAVLRKLRRLESALADCKRAIDLDRNLAEAYSNRSAVLADLNRLEAALASSEQAIALKVDLAEAHVNRGAVLERLNQLEAAVASHDRALAINPGLAAARFHRSMVSLLLGDFARGWADYEWRWDDEDGFLGRERREFPAPRWEGNESIAGKTILLQSEQGLGDTIQFCRYVPMLARLGARVILEVQPPLVSLLENLEGVSMVVARGMALPRFDCWSPLMSMPLAFNTRLDCIPTPGRYLAGRAAERAHWQAKLAGMSGPRIGLVWSGSSVHKNDRNRSLPLAELIEFLPSGFNYISLQKEIPEADRQTLRTRPDILDIAGEFRDFSDTAAACECLDLLISVDTSVAHLGGALGTRTWILLPFHPDWRWLMERADSPWYDSVTLYRQTSRGAWHEVLARMGAAVRAQ